MPVIHARDELHLIRGGTFVSGLDCPDGCAANACTHDGEPLNSSGKRERRTGPKTCRPANVDYAANFGGLVRMLKTDNDEARKTFRQLRKSNDVVNDYISFIHNYYPAEEVNQYKKAEWLALLKSLNVPANNISAAEANDLLRRTVSDYQEHLRRLF